MKHHILMTLVASMVSYAVIVDYVAALVENWFVDEILTIEAIEQIDNFHAFHGLVLSALVTSGAGRCF